MTDLGKVAGGSLSLPRPQQQLVGPTWTPYVYDPVDWTSVALVKVDAAPNPLFPGGSTGGGGEPTVPKVGQIWPRR